MSGVTRVRRVSVKYMLDDKSKTGNRKIVRRCPYNIIIYKNVPINASGQQILLHDKKERRKGL